MDLTQEAATRIVQLPRHLQTELPSASISAIEVDVRQQVSYLTADARFDDYVPLLAHTAVREHLRDQASPATAQQRRQSTTRAITRVSPPVERVIIRPVRHA